MSDVNDIYGGPPPPPPPEPGPEVHELTADLDLMIAGVEDAVSAYQAGSISLGELQERCLEAGTMRSGNVLLIWDWMNGTLFGYDGFTLTPLIPDPEPPPAP